MKHFHWIASALLCSMLPGPGMAEQRYFLKDLSSESSVKPYYRGLDNLGICYGQALLPTGTPHPMAVRQSNGTIEFTPVPSGHLLLAGSMRHTSGDYITVTNVSTPGAPSLQPFSYSSATGLTSMGTPYPNEQTGTEFRGQNAAGVVVGDVTRESSGASYHRAVRWQRVNGQWTFNLLPGAGQTYAMDINDSGLIVGSYNSQLGCVWDANLVRTELPVPTGWGSMGTGFDNSGHVWGTAYYYNSSTNLFDYGVFRWDSITEMPSLTFLGTASHPDVLMPWKGRQVNGAGVMAGTFEASVNNWQARIFTPGVGLENLNNLISPEAASLYNLRDAFQINDRGEILVEALGTAINPNQGVRTILLTPVPEPTSLLLLTPGLAWVVMRRRRPGTKV